MIIVVINRCYTWIPVFWEARGYSAESQGLVSSMEELLVWPVQPVYVQH